MDNKLSELSKPEQFDAEVETHDGEPFAVWAPAVNGSHVKKEQYFALLAELEAKDKRIAELEAIRAAAEKLVRCKGRYHSEQNYQALAALFGVTTPDLPPVDGDCEAVIAKMVHANQSQDDHINQQQDRIDSLEKINAVLARTLGAAEKRLATPVRLPDIEFVKISGIDFPVMRADIVKKEIRRAGFTVEGDEQDD